MKSNLAVRVERRALEADDVVSLEFRAVDGGSLPEFTPGAHIGLHLPSGLVRQYSLCNDPSERYRYVIAILRAPDSRGGSIEAHDLLKEGVVLQISGPQNDFPLQAAPQYLLFAGGIGITPILCMARYLYRLGVPFKVHYCSRSPAKMAFRQELQASPLGEHFHFHFDDQPASRLDISAIRGSLDGRAVYVCGPDGFINYVASSVRAAGVADDQIHWERFGGAPLRLGEVPFKIQLVSSGTLLDVPSDATALQVLLAHGCDVPSSCEQGSCGTCVVGLIGGEPDHRDSYLTDDERDTNALFVPCCSRAKSSVLLLDL